MKESLEECSFLLDEMRGFCSCCGKDLGTYGPNSSHKCTCPRCKAWIRVETHDHDVLVTVLSITKDRQGDHSKKLA